MNMYIEIGKNINKDGKRQHWQEISLMIDWLVKYIVLVVLGGI